MAFKEFLTALKYEIKTLISNYDFIRTNHASRVALYKYINNKDMFKSPEDLINALGLKREDSNPDGTLFLTLEQVNSNPSLKNELDSLAFINELRKINLSIIIDELVAQYYLNVEKEEKERILDEAMKLLKEEERFKKSWADYADYIKENEERAMRFLIIISTMNALKDEYNFLNKEIQMLRNSAIGTINNFTRKLILNDKMIPEKTQNKIDVRFFIESQKIYMEIRDEKLKNLHLMSNRRSLANKLFQPPPINLSTCINEDPRFKARCESAYSTIAVNECIKDGVISKEQQGEATNTIRESFTTSPEFLTELVNDFELMAKRQDQQSSLIEQFKEIKQNSKDELIISEEALDNIFDDMDFGEMDFGGMDLENEEPIRNAENRP